jgi:hypothetical protein
LKKLEEEKEQKFEGKQEKLTLKKFEEEEIRFSSWPAPPHL